MDVPTLLARLNASFPRLGTDVVDADEARRAFDALLRAPAAPTALADVRDETIPGPDGEPLALRWYRPTERPPHGTVLFLHGGGFVLGGFLSHDELLRRLARAAGATIVAVDYRLAPEHPYPAALDDAYRSLEHVAEHRHAGGLVVAGDSAGANLATACTMLARDHDGPPVDGQVLLYPMLDPRQATASYAENAEGRYITAAHLAWFWSQYGAGDRPEDLAAPALARDVAGLPRAHVVTAGLDPLRDEGEAYAVALADAGVAVTARRYDEMFHGFLAFTEILEPAAAALRDVADVIAGFLGAERC